jgi:hypothetical protein
MATSTASRQAQRASTAAATGRSRVTVPAVLAQASAHGVSKQAGSATQAACDAASGSHPCIVLLCWYRCRLALPAALCLRLLRVWPSVVRAWRPR